MTIIDIIGPFDFKTGMQPIEYTTNRERGCLEEQELAFGRQETGTNAQTVKQVASPFTLPTVVSLTSAGRLIQRLHHETGLSAVTDTPLHLIIGRAGLIDHHPFTSFKKFCIHRPISYAARGTTHSCRDTPAPDSDCRHERHP